MACGRLPLVATSPLPQQLFKNDCFSQTKYCGSSMGPLLVPHSIKRTQLRHSGGLQCPVWSHHSAESSSGAGPAARWPKGSSVGWSLCQGSVGQSEVAVVGLAGGWSMGVWPGCGWGGGELWPLWGEHRCHFPHYWSQCVTDTQCCWTARHSFRNRGNSLRARLELVLPQKTMGWGWCMYGHTGNEPLEFSAYCFPFLVFDLVVWFCWGFSALPIRSPIFKTQLSKWLCEPKCLLVIHRVNWAELVSSALSCDYFFSDWGRKFENSWLTSCQLRGNYDALDRVNMTGILEISLSTNWNSRQK